MIVLLITSLGKLALVIVVIIVVLVLAIVISLRYATLVDKNEKPIKGFKHERIPIYTEEWTNSITPFKTDKKELAPELSPLLVHLDLEEPENLKRYRETNNKNKEISKIVSSLQDSIHWKEVEKKIANMSDEEREQLEQMLIDKQSYKLNSKD